MHEMTPMTGALALGEALGLPVMAHAPNYEGLFVHFILPGGGCGLSKERFVEEGKRMLEDDLSLSFEADDDDAWLVMVGDYFLAKYKEKKRA